MVIWNCLAMISIRSFEQFWSSDSAQSLTRLWLSAKGGYLSAPSIVLSWETANLWTFKSQCRGGGSRGDQHAGSAEPTSARRGQF